VRLEGLGQLKKAMTSSGIELATSRLVIYIISFKSKNFRSYRTNGFMKYDEIHPSVD
jgi:hypothetical protein